MSYSVQRNKHIVVQPIGRHQGVMNNSKCAYELNVQQKSKYHNNKKITWGKLGYWSFKKYFTLKVFVASTATTWTGARQAPQSMGSSRQDYWNGLPFPSPGDLPDPGIEPRSPALQAGSLLSELPGKPSIPLHFHNFFFFFLQSGLLKIYSLNFQLHNTVLLSIVTMLYFTFPEFIHLIIGNLYPLTIFTHFPTTTVGDHQAVLWIYELGFCRFHM